MDNVLPAQSWFDKNQNLLIRWSLGICYFWFGMLKFFPNLSPAEQLAQLTIHKLTFGLIPDNISILLLAIWEVAVGILFFSGYFLRFATWAAIVHMVCTFTVLFLFPELSFSEAPYAWTLVGQYVVKNLVFLVVMGILLRDTKSQ